MNWRKTIGIAVAIVLIMLLIIKLKSNKEFTQTRVYQYDKDEAIVVHADTLRLENVFSDYGYSGTFEPAKETKVSAETQGKINSIFVDVGSQVNQGQHLVQLDNSLLKLQLQAVEVQIEGLETDVKRYAVLVKADAVQGVQLEKAELGLKSAKVQRATLLEQINKTTIKAPFGGIVTAKLNEIGAFAAPGVPLLQITDIAQLKFTVNIPENEIINFYLNQEYPLVAGVYPSIALSGKVVMVGSKANQGNSFPVQFLLPNTRNLQIKSGMFGKVQLQSQQEKGIIIPSSAIIGSAGQSQVYLIKEGKAVLKNIDVSEKIQNKTIVSNGLKEGDVLITNGFINLFEGANVKLNKIGE